MRNATSNATASASAGTSTAPHANTTANATAPIVDPEDLPPTKREYRVSAGNVTNATNPVQIDGLIHNADGSRNFEDGSPVGGVNDTWRYQAQKRHQNRMQKYSNRYAKKRNYLKTRVNENYKAHDWD